MRNEKGTYGRITKERIIIIPKTKVKIEESYFHGNDSACGRSCQCYKCSGIKLDSTLKGVEKVVVTSHEFVHKAFEIFVSAEGLMKEEIKELKVFDKKLDSDPFLAMVMIEYRMRRTYSPDNSFEKLLDMFWGAGLKIMRYIAALRMKGIID